MSEIKGKFVWYDLMTSDTKAAESFYRSVVGWDGKDSGMTDRSYTIFSMGLLWSPVSCLSRKAHVPWALVLFGRDISESTMWMRMRRSSRRQAALFAALLRISPVSAASPLSPHPQGATFALFRGSSEPPTAGEAEQRRALIGWHELQAADGAAAFAFYSGLFGWTKGPRHGHGLDGYLSNVCGGRASRLAA